MKRAKKNTLKKKKTMNTNGSGFSKYARKRALSRKGLNPRSPFKKA